jgi:hypothetical protein
LSRGLKKEPGIPHTFSVQKHILRDFEIPSFEGILGGKIIRKVVPGATFPEAETDSVHF